MLKRQDVIHLELTFSLGSLPILCLQDKIFVGRPHHHTITPLA